MSALPCGVTSLKIRAGKRTLQQVIADASDESASPNGFWGESCWIQIPQGVLADQQLPRNRLGWVAVL
jgi:hypothetical protein